MFTEPFLFFFPAFGCDLPFFFAVGTPPFFFLLSAPNSLSADGSFFFGQVLPFSGYGFLPPPFLFGWSEIGAPG